MAVTINDVARVANVAPSTVSRVIANNPNISIETKERVQKIIKEMNYHQNVIASFLANRSTKIIGLVVQGVTEKAFGHPFMPEIIRGITSMAHKFGYRILISSAEDIKEEKELISSLSSDGIAEGLILTTSRIQDPSIEQLMKQKFPFVLIGRPSDSEQINWVDNDNFSVTYELTKHFIGQGHRKIAFLGVSSEIIVTLDRYEGYKKALEDSGIELEPNLVVRGKFLDNSGYDMMKNLMDRGVDLTGVIACDDYIALGAIKLLTEYGIRIPEDIAIAGFNNTVLAEHSIPALTSVEIKASVLGASAFELLYHAIHDQRGDFGHTIIPAEIIQRASSIREF
jgi:DNA-binding LacI/PurR family transcriptional regulator